MMLMYQLTFVLCKVVAKLLFQSTKLSILLGAAMMLKTLTWVSRSNVLSNIGYGCLVGGRVVVGGISARISMQHPIHGHFQ